MPAMPTSPQRVTYFLTHQLTVLSVAVAAAIVVEAGYAQVPPTGTFTATQACPARQAINGQNPGNIQLEPGTTYPAVGFNSAQRRFVLLRVPGASPERRWVSADCGTFQTSNADSDSPNPDTPPGSDTPPANGLLAFFDTQDNPIDVDFPNGAQKDITPPPPPLEPFDIRVLRVCGDTFNAPVAKPDFRQLFIDYPDVLRKLKQATNGELMPDRRSDAEFLDDLTTAWFKHQGFKHVFCGEKDGNSIGGLHFYGRYIQFQQRGIAGRLSAANTREEVVDGVIYSFGVVVKQGDRVIASHPIKGYPYVLNAQEILLAATAALKQFNVPASTPANQSVACLYTVSDPAAQPFQAVFVEKDAAVRTFYPDATPDTSRTPPCQ